MVSHCLIFLQVHFTSINCFTLTSNLRLYLSFSFQLLLFWDLPSQLFTSMSSALKLQVEKSLQWRCSWPAGLLPDASSPQRMSFGILLSSHVMHIPTPSEEVLFKGSNHAWDSCSFYESTVWHFVPPSNVEDVIQALHVEGKKPHFKIWIRHPCLTTM